MMNSWHEVLVQPSSTIREIIQKIDASRLQIALVVDQDRKLLGTVTDGDVRRGLLRGLSLEDSARNVMNSQPTTAELEDDRGTLLATMRQKHIHHVPLVDGKGCLVGLETLEELLKPATRENEVVIMAGGEGRRLRPMTEACPKPMLLVGSRPLLETILLGFIEHGFRRFYLAVNHQADSIRNYFQDGSRWRIEIRYIQETSKLGTAGALGLLPERPTRPFVVMNGDLLTKVNLNHLLEFHELVGSVGTMCVREYQVQVPYGVIRVDGHEILAIEEKPSQKLFINAGIYVLDPSVLDIVPRPTYLDMTDVFEKLVEMNRKTAAFPLREYWQDVGLPSDFIKAKADFENMFK